MAKSSSSLKSIARDQASELVHAQADVVTAESEAAAAAKELRSAEAQYAAAEAVSRQLDQLAEDAAARATLSATALIQYARTSGGHGAPTPVDALFGNHGDLLGALGAVRQLERISADPQALADKADGDAARAASLREKADKAASAVSTDAVDAAEEQLASATEAVGTATAALETVQLETTTTDEPIIIGGAPDAGQLSDAGWTSPARGRITDGYGPRPSRPAGAGPFHYGVDIAAGCSDWVVAAASGTVVDAGWFGSLGNWVLIDHGQGVETGYGHLATGGTVVKVGDQVDAGEPIGLVGSTGASTGCHLHVEVHLNGVRTDPLPFFAARGVTLGD